MGMIFKPIAILDRPTQYNAAWGVMVLFVLLVMLTACSACSSEESSDNSLEEARQSFANKEFLDSEKLYERFLRQVPESEDRWEAWDRIAYIALNIRRDEHLAADILEAMALEYADKPEQYQDVLKRLAEIYESNHRWDRAQSAWARMLRSSSLEAEEQGQAHLHLAQIYQRRLDYVNATRHLESCLGLKLEPGIRAQALYSMAMVHGDQGEASEAEKKLLELTTMPDAPHEIQVQGLFMLADLMEEQGKPKEALELFKSIENTYPNPAAVEVRINALEGNKHKK